MCGEGACGDGDDGIVPLLLDRDVDGLELLGGDGNVMAASMLGNPGDSGGRLPSGTSSAADDACDGLCCSCFCC